MMVMVPGLEHGGDGIVRFSLSSQSTLHCRNSILGGKKDQLPHSSAIPHSWNQSSGWEDSVSDHPPYLVQRQVPPKHIETLPTNTAEMSLWERQFSFPNSGKVANKFWSEREAGLKNNEFLSSVWGDWLHLETDSGELHTLELSKIMKILVESN